MTRWLIRLAFPALGLLVALLIFGVKAPESPTTSPEGADEASTIPSFEALVPAPTRPTGPDIVFKWQAPDGSWHYADQPPENGNWNTLAIEPGQDTRTLQPVPPAPAEDDLISPYSAPFSLEPGQPRSDS
ncbi:DUF4124 domain-containing protein [Marinobacter bryozoorum]|jgi:hypothetical protein|uniref:DUF4124 domain-containing protein n=1 Tax=Marinobacter bryozoorum TaxID=256324 RepID=UPI0020068F7A|nr:DUF4124 domain-containing protein [Marinobacter bryozoorum]MCK7545251.1 DUF4124 domain-containing protein [Marinobacter bryozoorum]